MALKDAVDGSDCKILSVDDSSGKLASLGLVPGARVSVLNHCFGTIIICCKGSVLSLGRSVTEKLQVE